ncbi:hypothetical protein ANN_23006 [Periplaneta americana]|uniref:Reverse transcriptase domain-containing protein n=1 Tax=Periplaneta americana TaxID=6978 RepID=A0ABQ8SJV8_PERAM|nr:hypothetical protein ANN_23006 [Periplaneta americana]
MTKPFTSASLPVPFSMKLTITVAWVRGGSITWSPRSRDLNPSDFYLWKHLKPQVYSSFLFIVNMSTNLKQELTIYSEESFKATEVVGMASHSELLKFLCAQRVSPVSALPWLLDTARWTAISRSLGNVSQNTGVPQGSVLGPLLFIINVNDLCQNITSNVRLFADDFIIYRKIRNNTDVDAIQTDLNNIYNWVLMHRMKINGSKSKSITFCKTREETSLNYEFSGVVIPQEQCCKFLGVYLNTKRSWEEHVDNVTGNAWRALHFIMRILRKASPKSREIAYLTLVRPLMECGTTYWDPYRIYQINSLERIQYRAAKFVKGKREDGNDTIKELKWEPLENRRRKTRITSLYRAHLGQKAWVDITARLEKPTYYGRNDHDFKIKCRKQKTDVGEPNIINTVKTSRLRWAGHAIRMDPSEPCKKIVITNPEGQRRRGRPHLRWIDGVEEDARKLGCKNWKAATQDRDGWRQLLREAQAHQGL